MSKFQIAFINILLLAFCAKSSSEEQKPVLVSKPPSDPLEWVAMHPKITLVLSITEAIKTITAITKFPLTRNIAVTKGIYETAAPTGLKMKSLLPLVQLDFYHY